MLYRLIHRGLLAVKVRFAVAGVVLLLSALRTRGLRAPDALLSVSLD